MGDSTKDIKQIPLDEDQSDKRKRHAEGVESSEGKYPDHAEDIDFGGSGAVPYPERMRQTEEARAKHESKEDKEEDGRFIAERDSTGNTDFTSGGYRAFDSGVDKVETHPAPNLDGTTAGEPVVGEEQGTTVNKADNGSPESEDRAAAAKATDGGAAKDPKKSESSGKKAKAAAKKDSDR